VEQPRTGVSGTKCRLPDNYAFALHLTFVQKSKIIKKPNIRIKVIQNDF
jgi:hypothetical protein